MQQQRAARRPKRAWKPKVYLRPVTQVHAAKWAEGLNCILIADLYDCSINSACSSVHESFVPPWKFCEPLTLATLATQPYGLKQQVRVPLA